MPKGSSSSQASQNIQRGGGAAGQRTGAARPAPAGRRGMRQGPTRQRQVIQQSMEGIKISPLVVLGLSLSLIGVVTFLHIVGKIMG
ncbi:hypothetical protein HOP50_01g03250 [Chloropicon primus]|uniref:Protein transport protein Sec61 subunit beta n=1 Tax=Chloropicon primus TaxID=1764295 RepID=A0A5B8MBN8_9CHLO|nr:hypothetical protein A3770_01p03360 [Chloropicon primus]UPQ97034.1 hypothetical protein HOP50_01g03250 [Chloropicon primus]|eukprot:QDZ17818.1 hypothetical protein A3770_01p03360 [Chloropicon primus]